MTITTTEAIIHISQVLIRRGLPTDVHAPTLEQVVDALDRTKTLFPDCNGREFAAALGELRQRYGIVHP